MIGLDYVIVFSECCGFCGYQKYVTLGTFAQNIPIILLNHLTHTLTPGGNHRNIDRRVEECTTPHIQGRSKRFSSGQARKWVCRKEAASAVGRK